MLSDIFIISFLLIYVLSILIMFYRVKLKNRIKAEYPFVYNNLYGDNLLDHSKTIKLLSFIHSKSEWEDMKVNDDISLGLLRTLSQAEKVYFVSFFVAFVSFLFLFIL